MGMVKQQFLKYCVNSNQYSDCHINQTDTEYKTFV